ncbi:MAG TPA: CBS domain-containing protein [Solirubrobacteraceae bacterium]|nr:CBS domain-containing protein [Solirubrobacteraceae bacterium]
MAARSVQEIMAHDPVTVDVSASLADAARLMREHDTGAIVATDEGKVRGIVTDRDIVVRAIADGADPGRARVDDVCSANVVTLNPQDRLETAAETMRRHDVRRLPVVDGDRPIGIVSLGDLAIERDEDSALADISAAAPNT